MEMSMSKETKNNAVTLCILCSQLLRAFVFCPMLHLRLYICSSMFFSFFPSCFLNFIHFFLCDSKFSFYTRSSRPSFELPLQINLHTYILTYLHTYIPIYLHTVPFISVYLVFSVLLPYLSISQHKRYFSRDVWWVGWFKRTVELLTARQTVQKAYNKMGLMPTWIDGIDVFSRK